MKRLRENARALRALIATGAAVALAVLVFGFERAHTEAQSNAVHELNRMLWGVSELNFESQRLITALTSVSLGEVSHDAVKLRFDVVWSRVDVVVLEKFTKDTGFHELMAEFEGFLNRWDPVIYGEDLPDRTVLQNVAEDLAALTVRSRQLWSQNFGTQHPAQRVLTTLPGEGRQGQQTALALFLIALLLAYVVVEVFFANRAHKREVALRLEAADANEAKSRFLANVSHEIRTPLNGILGMASELSESSLTQDQSQCLRVIEQSGSVLLGTINDVLDLSRIEAGQLLVNEHPFVLRDVVEAACALYSAHAREKGLTLKIQVQENLPEVVLGDEVRIRQVLHNLIANAVKFTEKGGVSVRVRPDLNGCRVVFAVQDSGPGIDREAQRRVFEPFRQADASVTRQHGGSGLGLSISRQLCHAMEGELSLVSRLGHGATFFCDLPLKPANAEEVRKIAQPPTQAPELGGLRILVADDNSTNRLILSRFLAKTGADLVYATSGVEALEAQRAKRFDVILMDVQMPVMDGVAATLKIREAERRTEQKPSIIVAVTANVLSHQVQEYRNAGMDEVLGKPVSKRDLLAVLARYSQKQAA